MKVVFIYPAFERHADSHPELRSMVPCREYLGPPSLGIAFLAACTPPGIETEFVDDRVSPVTRHLPDADLYALSFFTPAATRALAIGDMLRELGKPVVMGGIFPTTMPEEVGRHCDAVVIGEGEPVWPDVCRDAAARRLKPRYRAATPARLDQIPAPRVGLYLDAEQPVLTPDDYPMQLSRGCPLRCDCCALPASMGDAVRFFPESTVLETFEQLVARGKRCGLTEDTSFFHPERLRSFLEKVAKRRETEPLRLSYVGISPPMLLTIDDGLFDVMRRAGFELLYVVCGFDPMTRAAFATGEPKALALAETSVRRCQDHGIEPYVSFLVGNDDDDEGTFDHILAFADRTRLNLAEFGITTPYPGTPMWERILQEGRLLDRRWRRYNDAHVVYQPRKMSPERLQAGYLYLWKEFYRTRQHIKQATSRNTIQF